MSGESDFHVDISKYLGEKRKSSTWARNKTSEESNETSEEWNETSEEFFDAYVEIWDLPRGYSRKEGIGRISP